MVFHFIGATRDGASGGRRMSVLRTPTNGRWRTLIIIETILLTFLVLLLGAIMIFAFVYDAFGISWFAVGIAGAATLAEVVRRARHLRSDLRRDYHR